MTISKTNRFYLIFHLYNFLMALTAGYFSKYGFYIAAIYLIPFVLLVIKKVTANKFWILLKIVLGIIFIAGYPIVLMGFGTSGGGGYEGFYYILVAALYLLLYLITIPLEHNHRLAVIPFILAATLLGLFTFALFMGLNLPKKFVTTYEKNIKDNAMNKALKQIERGDYASVADMTRICGNLADGWDFACFINLAKKEMDPRVCDSMAGVYRVIECKRRALE